MERRTLYNQARKKCSMLPTAALALILTAGCTGGNESDNSNKSSPRPDKDKTISVCDIASKEAVAKYTGMAVGDLLNSSCATNQEAGVIWQQTWTVKVGSVVETGQFVTTLVQEDTARQTDGLSFARLGNNVPTALKQQREIAGKLREVYISDNGMAVSLGNLTLSVSLEASGTADSATNIVPVTLDPARRGDGAEGLAATLENYVAYVAGEVQEG